MSSLEGSITLQAFGAVFFPLSLALSAFFIDAFIEICERKRGKNTDAGGKSTHFCQGWILLLPAVSEQLRGRDERLFL